MIDRNIAEAGMFLKKDAETSSARQKGEFKIY